MSDLTLSKDYTYTQHKDGLGYNPLMDVHLKAYYANRKRRKHLERMGRVSRKGEVRDHVHIDRRAAKQEKQQRIRRQKGRAAEKDYEYEETKRLARNIQQFEELSLKQRVRQQRAARLMSQSLPTGLGSMLSSARAQSAKPSRSRPATLKRATSGPLAAAAQPRRSRPVSAQPMFSRPTSASSLRASSKKVPKSRPLPSTVRMRLRYHGVKAAAGYEHVSGHYGGPEQPRASRKRKEQLRLQQNTPGLPTTILFDGLVEPGDLITIKSNRKDAPFSLTVFKNNFRWETLSACCEYHYHPGARLGGSTGILSLGQVSGGRPCVKCQVRRRLEGLDDDDDDDDGSWAKPSQRPGSFNRMPCFDEHVEDEYNPYLYSDLVSSVPPTSLAARSDDDSSDSNTSYYDDQSSRSDSDDENLSTDSQSESTSSPAISRAKRSAKQEQEEDMSHLSSFERLKLRLARKEEAKSSGRRYPSLFLPPAPEVDKDAAKAAFQFCSTSRSKSSTSDTILSRQRGQGDGADVTEASDPPTATAPLVKSAVSRPSLSAPSAPRTRRPDPGSKEAKTPKPLKTVPAPKVSMSRKPHQPSVVTPPSSTANVAEVDAESSSQAWETDDSSAERSGAEPAADPELAAGPDTDDVFDDDDNPPALLRRKALPHKMHPVASTNAPADEDDDDEPPALLRRKPLPNKEPISEPAIAAKDDDDDDDDEPPPLKKKATPPSVPKALKGPSRPSCATVAPPPQTKVSSGPSSRSSSRRVSWSSDFDVRQYTPEVGIEEDTLFSPTAVAPTLEPISDVVVHHAGSNQDNSDSESEDSVQHSPGYDDLDIEQLFESSDEEGDDSIVLSQALTGIPRLRRTNSWEKRTSPEA